MPDQKQPIIQSERNYIDSYELADKEIKFHLAKKGSDYVIHFINTDVEVDIPDTEEKAKMLFEFAKRNAETVSNEDDLISLLDEEMLKSVRDKAIEKGTIV